MDQSTTPMTDAELMEFQEHMIKRSKESLNEVGSIIPTAYVIARKMEIDPWLRESVLDAQTWSPPTNVDEKPAEFIFLVIPCLYDDPNTLLMMIKYLCDNPIDASKTIDGLIAMGHSLGKKDPIEYVVGVFKEAFNMHQKDIVAAFLKKVCNTTAAHGLIKIDEAWYKDTKITKDEAKYKEGDLSTDPESKETLMVYMETRTFKCQILEPFIRERKGEGEIISWGERVTWMDTGEEGSKILKGRFCNLLQPVRPATDAPQKG